MRRTGLTIAGVLFATVALAVTAKDSAQPATSQTLNLTASSQHRVYPSSFTHKLGEVRGYRGEIAGTDTGTYRATCIWLGNQGEKRLDCTVVLRLLGGMLVVHGLVDRPGSPRLLSQTSSAGQLAITGGTGQYNGARGYVQLNPQYLTVVII